MQVHSPKSSFGDKTGSSHFLIHADRKDSGFSWELDALMVD